MNNQVKVGNQVKVENQVKAGKQGTAGRIIIRSYQARFSCMEAVERLIEIHYAAGEESDGQEKSQVPSA